MHASTDGFSFLTQVDLGLDWQITQHVSTQFGYRLVAITGMGLSDGQIPFFGNDTLAIAGIQHNDSLILHGAFRRLDVYMVSIPSGIAIRAAAREGGWPPPCVLRTGRVGKE